jgi:hypothetical protein
MIYDIIYQMDLFLKYTQQVAEDLKCSSLNIKEAQMLLPSKKHFWVARLIEQKVSLTNLKKKKDKLVKALIENKQTNSPVALSKLNLEKMCQANDTVDKLTEEIKETEMIVEYLEKVEKIFSAMTYDYKNIVELMKMEQM